MATSKRLTFYIRNKKNSLTHIPDVGQHIYRVKNVKAEPAW